MANVFRTRLVLTKRVAVYTPSGILQSDFVVGDKVSVTAYGVLSDGADVISRVSSVSLRIKVLKPDGSVAADRTVSGVKQSDGTWVFELPTIITLDVAGTWTVEIPSGEATLSDGTRVPLNLSGQTQYQFNVAQPQQPQPPPPSPPEEQPPETGQQPAQQQPPSITEIFMRSVSLGGFRIPIWLLILIALFILLLLLRK